MRRPGFQTKLMLAMTAAIAAVTSVVLMLTGRGVTSAYAQLFQERFRAQVDYFAERREDRVVMLEEACQRVAEAPDVIEAMRLDPGAGRNEALRVLFNAGVRTLPFAQRTNSGRGEARGPGGPGALTGPGAPARGLDRTPPPDFPRERGRGERIELEGVPGQPERREGGRRGERDSGRGERQSGPRDRRGPEGLMACIVDREGVVIPLAGMGNEQPEERLAALRPLARDEDAKEGGFGYVVIELANGRSEVREAAARPVLDPADGSLLGMLVVGFRPDDPVEVMYQRFSRDIEGAAGGRSGILVAGRFFGRDFTRNEAEEISRVLEGATSAKSESGTGDGFEARLGETVYEIFSRALPAVGGFPAAYQVSLQSAEPLHRDLRALQRRIVGAGVLGLSLAAVLAMLLSRGFGKPVRELARATDRIRQGDYGARVPERGTDELGVLARSFNAMAEDLALKEKYRSVLDKVADRDVAESLLTGDLGLGGEMRMVTVLFCDIRGFTAMTEAMTPQEVVRLLNDHMTVMTRLVYEHGGVVDKFVGDLVMALFGVPKSYGNDSLNACRCALAMVDACLRAARSENSRRELRIGLGIATGKMVAGCMGSEDRLNYTVVGEKVNLASRLCDAAGPMEILIDEETRIQGGSEIAAERTGTPSMKGVSRTLEIYRLVDPQLRVAEVSEPLAH
ncbi:MAG TPA: adenylate/guanylate cyclase domain-containing protein [Verrucomicrobiales bacterium]|nr:adenylate/guanylate cyclase domain-containing protein [Verrucomicrobiales bacterium]